MKALHKLIEERVKPNFTGEGKLKRFWVVFDALETFLFTPGHTTKKGVHVRDGIDLKRTMFLVIVAMVPALLPLLLPTTTALSLKTSSQVSSEART